MEQPTTPSSNPTPKTDAEWIIHSINIHGLFFEHWCQDVIRRIGRWQVRSTNYPVEFPPAQAQARSTESSALDIRAELPVGMDQKLTLLIECKKHNPDFVNWIFSKFSERGFYSREYLSDRKYRNRRLLISLVPTHPPWAYRIAFHHDE